MVEVAFGDDDLWDDVLKRLIERLGGLDNITSVLSKVVPEFVEVEFSVPARLSEEQEDRYLSPDSVAIINAIGGSFAISVS